MSKVFLKGQLYFGIIRVGVAGMILFAGNNSYAQVSKKVGKLNFQVPEDWPVEKRGGLMMPVETEEYVSIKFKEIEKEFLAVRDEFSEKFSGFQSDLKSIEEDLSKEIKKFRSENEAQEESGADLMDILSSIEMLKSELVRLDRKITNKIKSMQIQFEDMSAGTEIELIKENIDWLQAQVYRLDEKIDYLQESQESSY